MNRTKVMLVVLAAFLVMAFSAAQADNIVLATAPMGANTVDWSSTGLPVGFQAHGFIGYTTFGDTATATVSGATSRKGELIQQGNNWNGNFASGMYGLWTANATQFVGYGPLTVSMGQSYNFLGAYFQQDYYGAFTAKIDVYNGSTLLASFTENGYSDGTPGTAIFIGAYDSTAAHITKIVFSETAGLHPADFAIGTMYAAAAPEPGTLVLLGTGLIGLAGVARRRYIR